MSENARNYSEFTQKLHNQDQDAATQLTV